MENEIFTELEESKKQLKIMLKIKDLLLSEELKTGKRRSYFVFTSGCQMNAHDSEKLAGMLETMGYIAAETEEKADFVIYNTCCIRENAEEKIFGRLGRLKFYKNKRPELKIAVCGCMTQQDTVIEKMKKSYRFIDIVFGTFNLHRLPELILTSMNSDRTVFDIWKEERGIIEDIPMLHENNIKASVNIMYGCDNFCSYCIVPYVRGRERSREPSEVLAEIKKLVDKGAKEITLLGQNVNSYGKNLQNPISFASLLRQVNEISGLERIRFMTSHPKDISDELIKTMSECSKLGSYIHLPFQSGSTEILRRMNRRYSKEHYLEIVEKVRKAVPNIHISTDIIVGFPGETEQDFQETLDVCKKARFSAAYTFIYSKRTGTPAAIMDDQVSEEIIKDRFQRLLDTLKPITHEINEAQFGNTVDVLVEEINNKEGGLLSGRAENNTLVHFSGSEELIGKIIPIKITKNKTFYLLGERA